MESTPNPRTLYEDWTARRDVLVSHAYGAGDYAAVQRQLLDFLLRRYRDAPEAAQPARFPIGTEVGINHRAIVVIHHLGGGRIPKVTSQSEAQARVRSIVERMLAPTSDAAVGMREAIASGACPTVRDPIELLRMRLCDDNPVARILAAVQLGEVGSLDDIGLLSDLLALPVAADEHAEERAALVHSMQQLAGVVTEPFDLSKVIPPAPSPSPPRVEEPCVVLPDWHCSKCGVEVPGNFDVCWECGTSIDGKEDPGFCRADEV